MRGKRAVLGLWFAGQAMAAPAMAAGPYDVKRWQYFEAVDAAGGGDLAVAPAGREMFLRARPDLADLRVVRDGEETAYTIRISRGERTVEEARPALIDQTSVDGRAVQVTLDFGAGRRVRHSRVRLSTPEKNFRNRVRVETGDDNRTWKVARDDGYIFDFSQGAVHAAILSVDYPVSTRRYARVTVEGFSRPDSISGAAAAYVSEDPVRRDRMAECVPGRSEDAKARASVLVFDLGHEMPHDRMVLETGAGPFYRAVEIESSADGRQWKHVSPAALFRVPGDEPSVLAYREISSRFVRLRIFNGDDAPVAVSRAVFEAPRREVLFRAGAAGRYRIYAGNPSAPAPSYDLPAILARTRLSERAAEAGKWEENPEYEPPAPPRKPFSERFPGLLPGSLVAAALVMGYLALQLLRKTKSA